MSAEEAEPAVLVRGPIQHSGIEYLGVNAVEAVYGEYAYNRQIIPVYYTDKDIFIPDEWSEAACAQSGLKHLGSSESSAAREVFVYSDRRGWHAFFSFPADAELYMQIHRSLH